ncbi:MAG: type II toxin-antitoxin system HicB family antitoxin, partial [Lachnospiraceae bacterium]|nr:type II toxin-antitoxin system HicB family antitoxin [Lachnospiraceae bacterium]
MVLVYPVLFTRTGDEKDTYLVEIPDIRGLTEGYGIADAIRMARDYIGLHFCRMDDEKITPPSRIEDIDPQKGEFSGDGETTVSLVDLDLDAYRRSLSKKSVRRNVTLPGWLDEEATKRHINVSRVL